MRGGGKSILNTQLPVCRNRTSFLHNNVVKTIVIHSKAIDVLCTVLAYGYIFVGNHKLIQI
jgi:hypothetical protein